MDNRPIDNCEISFRIANALKRAGITTTDEANEFALDKGLPSLPALGRKSFNEVREVFAALGYETRRWVSVDECNRRLVASKKASPKVGRSVWLTIDELTEIVLGTVPDTAAAKFAGAKVWLDERHKPISAPARH